MVVEPVTTILRGYKTELNPNNKQRSWLKQCAGTARYIYNWGVMEWTIWFFHAGIRPVSAGRLKKYFNNMEKDDIAPWIRQYPQSIIDPTFMNLGRAFDNFWRQHKDGTVQKRIDAMKNGRWERSVAKAKERGWPIFTVMPGYPRRKRESRSFQIRQFRIFDDCVELGRRKEDVGRFGAIRLKERDYLPFGDVNYGTYVTISTRAGRWYLSVLVKDEIPDPMNDSMLIIGIDLGLKTRVVCSDGTVYDASKPLREAQRRLGRLNKELDRRKTVKGANWHKTKIKLARQHARIANIRQHHLHQISHDLVVNKRPGVIVIENLNVSGMLKNHSLAQAVSDAGFYELRRQIEYKAQRHGVQVYVADTFFPSSRLCRFCGAINENLTLDDRVWECDCGAILDRDLNAAKNLAALIKAETQPDCLGS